jgi:acyl transferase domain-containing protein
VRKEEGGLELTRRIEELLAKIAEHRARLQSTGTLSDDSNSQTQIFKITDELAFIVQGQFNEIEKMKKRLHQLEKVPRIARRK